MIQQKDNNNNIFHSPSYGEMDLFGVRKKIIEFMESSPEKKYHLIIGTDSQPKNGQGADFVTAILIHRLGSGGIYFWKRNMLHKKMALRERIYLEATSSLIMAEELLEACRSDGITKYDVEIHVDIGEFGETRNMISEVVGMVRSSGFIVKTKPEAYGASKVADRYT